MLRTRSKTPHLDKSTCPLDRYLTFTDTCPAPLGAMMDLELTHFEPHQIGIPTQQKFKNAFLGIVEERKRQRNIAVGFVRKRVEQCVTQTGYL